MQYIASGVPIVSLANLRRGIKLSLPDSSSVSKTKQILGNFMPYS
jgi:hypothetical protein